MPTDGSDYAQAAANHAIELALATEAALHIVHVVDVGVVTGSVNTAAILDALEEAGEQALQEVIDQAEEAGVSVIEATVLGGSPYRAIVKYADEHDIDLLAMGTHGRTGVDRYFLGSVTERVVRRTEVPVLVVSIPGRAD
ncbi:universal stress protein [Haloferax mediterranei]|uniref:universal stress protein n=1 Tax=Haloferax mediterranei TaxID=2252 RepID=UPI001E440293|nr:universal stress protein [Haloferax mediterranei]